MTIFHTTLRKMLCTPLSELLIKYLQVKKQIYWKDNFLGSILKHKHVFQAKNLGLFFSITENYAVVLQLFQ